MTIPIDAAWLSRSSTEVAPDLIGCSLIRQFDQGDIIRGMIVETEAYTPDDPACHAYRGLTPRNAAMFGSAGCSYVYFIYGMYHCLNVVTDLKGVGSAVLLRALQLQTVPAWMMPDKPAQMHRVAAGPGKLCKALKIDRSFTAQPLKPGSSLWLEHRSSAFQSALNEQAIRLVQTTRIGISQAAERPWRWYLKDCSAVSKR
jgi:DNA-3-methyladenine glycosylase